MEIVEKFLKKYPREKVMKCYKNTCIAEAITCFLLYGIAMIWIREDKENSLALVFIITIGNLHGLFFTMYLLLCIPARKIYKWDDEDFVFALLAAFFPFATIWVEKKLARLDRS